MTGRRIAVGAALLCTAVTSGAALALSPAAAMAAIVALGSGTLLGRYIRAVARRGR